MSTTLIKNRKRAVKGVKEELTWQMQNFCDYYLADVAMDGKVAAKKAGYPYPSQAACRLLKNKAVQAYLGRQKQMRQERTRRTADEVLTFVDYAAHFDPLEFFSPGGGNGGFLIKPEELKNVPKHVRQLITECDAKEVETEQGCVRMLRVRFMDKDKMTELLMKHHGLFEKDNSQQNKLLVDLSQLYKRPATQPDPVEQLIAKPEPPRKIEAKMIDSETLKPVKYSVAEIVDDPEGS